MSKRNITLVIVFLVLLGALYFAFSYFFKTPTNNGDVSGEESTGTNFISDFFNTIRNQTSKNDADNENVIDVGEDFSNEEGSETEATRARLYKISNMPIVGFGIYKKEVFEVVPESTLLDEKSTEKAKPVAPSTQFVETIRYVDKGSGNIYQSNLGSVSERKVSETTIMGVREAYFGDNSNSVIMRYLKTDKKTIATFVGTLVKEVLGGDTTNSNEISGSFLPEDIKNLSVSPDTSKLFYMYQVKDTMVGITSTFLGLNKTQVFDSPFTEWLSEWPTNNLITITTKASGYVPGYMYGINPNKKDLTKILGGINGLTTLTSPDGKKVLYSNNNLDVRTYNMETKESNQLGIKTLTEKCVWSKDSLSVYCAVPRYVDVALVYPDVWYQGEVSFGDIVWKINLDNNNKTVVIDPVLLGGFEDMDITKLTLDDKETNLFFVNKKDSYLWGVEIK